MLKDGLQGYWEPSKAVPWWLHYLVSLCVCFRRPPKNSAGFAPCACPCRFLFTALASVRPPGPRLSRCWQNNFRDKVEVARSFILLSHAVRGPRGQPDSVADEPRKDAVQCLGYTILVCERHTQRRQRPLKTLPWGQKSFLVGRLCNDHV